MNIKRLILACIAVFVFVYLYDFVLHVFLLKDAYAQTASMWRPESEMKVGLLALGQLLRSVVFCLIYAVRPGHRDGVGAGMGFGLMIALMLIGTDLITYAVQPLPLSLICSWSIGGLIQLLIAGALLGAIYRPASQSTGSATAGAPA